MSKKSRTRSKVRLSRALGVALTPKAARLMEKRPYAPGQHGRTRRRTDSDYAVRLREKQRLRAQYGLREKQLRITFEEARRQPGLTGENLVELLEMRLDSLVLRAGFARTTAQARQLVVHRHILVDGKIVDRPSFRVKPGQLIHV
ncbi:MAG: 30S ribosomal protein S4, partial [Microbacteriaceae bacterium]|nr:30S ribosomal protein S4 [Microbacteriaceae bacterium]